MTVDALLQSARQQIYVDCQESAAVAWAALGKYQGILAQPLPDSSEGMDEWQAECSAVRDKVRAAHFQWHCNLNKLQTVTNALCALTEPGHN